MLIALGPVMVVLTKTIADGQEVRKAVYINSYNATIFKVLQIQGTNIIYLALGRSSAAALIICIH